MVSSVIPDWQTILEFIDKLGTTEGVFVILFFVLHAWIFMLYKGRIKDRQREIDRLADENHEYRERFVLLLDKQFGFKR
ncbi:MAG: hypothetical protein WC476_12420 [Phycisphaerae bacterium]|jgi:hypothetical protein